MRWPTGPEMSSEELIRITVDGTDRAVTFAQPKAATEAQTDTASADKIKKRPKAHQQEDGGENPSAPQAAGSGLATIPATDAQLAEEMEMVKSYTAAAIQGDAEAQFGLGTMCADGRGVQRDDKEVVKWFRKAAEQGHAKAQLNLGMMYAGGKGVPRVDKEAVKWFRKATVSSRRGCMT